MKCIPPELEHGVKAASPTRTVPCLTALPIPLLVNLILCEINAVLTSSFAKALNIWEQVQGQHGSGKNGTRGASPPSEDDLNSPPTFRRGWWIRNEFTLGFETVLIWLHSEWKKAIASLKMVYTTRNASPLSRLASAVACECWCYAHALRIISSSCHYRWIQRKRHEGLICSSRTPQIGCADLNAGA